ncbi:MAG: DDE-type integrase/transposase/recombinase, partial [Bacteroidetes bacterium]|nr:DDE-type integrase/transposase/recombinase [Bacteroidota bacterium]
MTAFTIPNQDQYQWNVTAMGLKSAPAAFQRMIQDAIRGTSNVIPYIDDCIVHSQDFQTHLTHLRKFFEAMRENQLKLNLKKCFIGTKEVTYLGFRLTSEGIFPGNDKLACIAKARPPTTVTEVKQFLGLCNFFRHHIKDFSLIAGPLNRLTRKDATWPNGQLPHNAMKAFQILQKQLISKPVIGFPRRDRPYQLYVDAATGNDDHDGGLGGILCQVQEKEKPVVIAYASRSLSKHERNYTPFLLEMTAAVWAMDHFDNYLRGKHFTLFTDHKPLEKLGKVHTKTLNRLQQAMMDYSFEVKHKAGKEMPADYLSRHVHEIHHHENYFQEIDLPSFQKQDELCNSIRELINSPKNAPLYEKSVVKLAKRCVILDDVIQVTMDDNVNNNEHVPLIPKLLTLDILKMAHDHPLAGHAGILKTSKRALQYGYWPYMNTQIQEYVRNCITCQKRRTDDLPPPDVSHPLTTCTNFNERVHLDLFGPLKSVHGGHRYILCMTDAFSRYATMTVITDKEASTVIDAIFKHWICKFGTPIEFLTDRGKEFVNKMNDEMCKLFQIKHLKTSGYHPQTNTYAEVCNKTIARYLASFVDKTTLNWEDYVEPMNFAYNTSFHESTRLTPFFLTFGREARLPELIKKNYSESFVGHWYQRFKVAKEMAVKNHLVSTDKYAKFNDVKAMPHLFQPGQKVLLRVNYFFGKNKKFAEKFEGPFTIIKRENNGLIEIDVNNRVVRVNVDKVKPFHENSPTLPQVDEAKNPLSKRQQQPQQKEFLSHANDNFNNNENGVPKNVAHPLADNVTPSINDDDMDDNDPDIEKPVARRKYVKRIFAPVPIEERRMTRALAHALRNDEMLPQQQQQQQQLVEAVVRRNAVPGLDKIRLDDNNMPIEMRKHKKLAERLRFINKLPQQTKNLILTGDPYLRFDPWLYESVFANANLWQQPIIVEHFGHLLPELPETPQQSSSSASSTSDSDNTSGSSSNNHASLDNSNDDDYLSADDFTPGPGTPITKEKSPRRRKDFRGKIIPFNISDEGNSNSDEDANFEFTFKKPVTDPELDPIRRVRIGSRFPSGDSPSSSKTGSSDN